jgi:hypothetical protein
LVLIRIMEWNGAWCVFILVGFWALELSIFE